MQYTKHIFLSILLAVVSLSYAQTTTVYHCDFEDDQQNASWVFTSESSIGHQWTIGQAAHNGGSHGLYVSTDHGQQSDYAATNAIVYAYTDITVPLDTVLYTLTFDWIAGGYLSAGIDGLYVAWVPDRDDLGDSIVIKSQGNYVLPNMLVDYALPINPVAVQTAGVANTSWQVFRSIHTSMYDTRIKADGKHHRLVFAWRTSSGAVALPGPCVDNIGIFSASDCGDPYDFKLQPVGEDTLLLSWNGDPDTYEVGCYNYEYGTRLTQRINAHSCSFVGLEEGLCDFYVRTVCYDSTSQKDLLGVKLTDQRFIYYPGRHCIDYITISDENCYINNAQPSYVTGDYLFRNGMVDGGSESLLSRHTHHYSHAETDPRTQGLLHTVPDDEIASFRLGNWVNGHEAERAEFTFHVDAETNPILVMKYAVVLENPGHDTDKSHTSLSLEDPRFTLKVYDGSRSVGHCAQADFTASWVRDGWHSCTVPVEGQGVSNVVWKDWTTIGVNLSEYDGKTLKIQLTTYDCSLGAHFGYAYFTLGCAKDKLDGLNCDGTPSTLFTAPVGFKYKWYFSSDTLRANVLSQEATFRVDSMDQREYMVDVIFPEDTSCMFTLYASSKPHYPVPSLKWQHTPSNCENYITFTNESQIHTINIFPDHRDTIVTPCSQVEWDFGSIAPKSVQTKTNKIRFPNEGGQFPVSITAYLDNCWQTLDTIINVPAIGEVVKDTLISMCPGSTISFNGKQYTEAGLYYDTLTAWTGCDSILAIHIDTIAVSYQGSKTVILKGESFPFHGRSITQTGVYYDTLRTIVNGCDSIIDSIYVLVHENVRVTWQRYQTICGDQTSFSLPYTIVQGVSAYAYSSVWDTPDILSSDSLPLPDDNVLLIDFSQPLKPNHYVGILTFHDSLRYVAPEKIHDWVDTVYLTVNYPGSVLVQRWNDILAMKNTENNGGYTFSDYQWYKDGSLIPDATLPYLYVEEGLDFGSVYTVEVTRADDGVRLMTCPPESFEYVSQSNLPTLVERSASIPMRNTGVAVWLTPLGVKVNSQNYDYNDIIAPARSGLYLLKLGESVTRIVVK